VASLGRDVGHAHRGVLGLATTSRLA